LSRSKPRAATKKGRREDVLDVNFFDELRIGLATADDIRQWSFGVRYEEGMIFIGEGLKG